MENIAPKVYPGLRRGEKIRSFILSQIRQHPKDIVTFAARRFRVSRQNIHQYIATLLAEEKIGKFGEKRGVSYYLPSQRSLKFNFKVVPTLDEHMIWKKHLEKNFLRLPENIADVCSYGFTEMFNNVIDHSLARRVSVEFRLRRGEVFLAISDDGIGIFKKIRDTFCLSDLREALLHLTKGKVTTDPKHHTGEGIFFTSRAFDRFCAAANGIAYLRFSDQDWSVEASDVKKRGTRIEMQIALRSKRLLRDLFHQYTDEETYEFDKTEISVELSRDNPQDLISRSQAKRILTGLGKFRFITLDFKGVRSVGQSFVDEIFRVFKESHPAITIEYRNANPEVEFMIKRGL